MTPYDRWPAWALEAERLGWGDPSAPTCDPELVVTLNGWRPHYAVTVSPERIVFTDTIETDRAPLVYERGWLIRLAAMRGAA